MSGINVFDQLRTAQGFDYRSLYSWQTRLCLKPGVASPKIRKPKGNF
jgi:hypothetical protein